MQESCAFKIQGRSKNWSGPDPTDPTGSAGPDAVIILLSVTSVLYIYMCDTLDFEYWVTSYYEFTA